MKHLDEQQTMALERRRRKLNSQISTLMGILRESINTGQPVLHTARWRSALLHFEADRIVAERIIKGEQLDNDEVVAEIARSLCREGHCDWITGPEGLDVCNTCGAKEPRE
jgi:hypothetical protein